MKTLEQQLNPKLETYREVRGMLEAIAEGMYKIYHGHNADNACLDDLELHTNGSHVDACFSEYWCGETNYSTYTFPTSYLWDLDWEEKEEEIKTRRNLEVLEKKEQEEKEKREKKERRSYQNYLVLKRKYDKGDQS